MLLKEQKLQKREVEIIRKTETSEGQTIKHWVLTRYLFMIDVAMYEIEHTVYSPSFFEKCLNCCCSAYSCKWLLLPFKKRRYGVQEEQKVVKDLIPKTDKHRL